MNVNTPELWKNLLPTPDQNAHKYMRGHLVILGGTHMTGAARLASEAGMRMGAGLCTIIAPNSVGEIYKKGAPHIMFEALQKPDDFTPHFNDPRRTAAIIGPGAGLDNPDNLKKIILGALALKKPVVLDADAITVFADDPEKLFSALHDKIILTPHTGEFARLFGTIPGTRTEQALFAAKKSGAIILLKGPETTIATPDGRCVTNTHASPYLATAGSGDVLTGMIGGLLAQGMEPFAAASAATWMHGDAAIRFGAGLVAPDIIQMIATVIQALATSPQA